MVQLPLVVLLQFGAMHVFGIYSFIWRYIGMAEVAAFLKAAWWSFLPLLVLRLALPDEFAQWRIPLSIILMTTVFGFGGRACPAGDCGGRSTSGTRRRAGVGHSKGERSAEIRCCWSAPGRRVCWRRREITNRGDMGLDIRGFIDDDAEQAGIGDPGGQGHRHHPGSAAAGAGARHRPRGHHHRAGLANGHPAHR